MAAGYQLNVDVAASVPSNSSKLVTFAYFLFIPVYIPTTGSSGGKGGGGSGDFFAVDMVDRKIRLLWNNGGGSATKIVTHNVTIESATSRDNLLTNEHMWYKITAERTGNIGRLNVRKVRPVSIRQK